MTNIKEITSLGDIREIGGLKIRDIGDSTSFFELNEINLKTSSNLRKTVNENDFEISSLVIEENQNPNFRKVVVERPVIDFLKGDKTLNVLFVKILDATDKILVENEKNYLIHINIALEENNGILFNIFVSKKDVGTLINLWNRIQEMIISETSEIKDLEKRAKMKTIFSINITDIENGYKI